MIIKYKIGTLPGEYPPGTFIQDSAFHMWRLVYWIINGTDSEEFTQNKSEWRATWNQTFNSGDIIICHFVSY